MATQAQWYAKLKTWVPAGFVTDGTLNGAVFQALAKVLASAQSEASATVAQTFLDDATGFYLDLHGSERVVDRYDNESDASYRERIRNIDNTTSYQTLYNVIKAALNNGDPILIENWAYGFADDEFFFDCADSVYLSKTRQLNRFTVIIPDQLLADETDLKNIIVSAIDDKKALGVFADIIYRTS